MSWRRALLIFCGAFVLSLLASAPPWLLTDRLDLPPQVRMAPPEGSLWRGSLPWLEVDGLRIDALRWRVRPFGLFSGTPLRLSSAPPWELRLNVGVGPRGLRLHDGSGQASLTRLVDALAPFNPGIDADIVVSISQVRLAPDGCRELSGGVRVDGWRGQHEALAELGPLAGDLRCDNGRLVLDIDQDNRLDLQGQAVVGPAGDYQLNLRAAPPPGPLYDLLQDLLGAPRGGVFTLQLRS